MQTLEEQMQRPCLQHIFSGKYDPWSVRAADTAYESMWKWEMSMNLQRKWEMSMQL